MKQLTGNAFFRTAACALVLALPAAASPDDAVREPVLEPPSELFGDFFGKVAMSGLFVDSKQWADAVPKRPPQEILARAANLDYDSPQALGDFLKLHFELNPAAPPAVEPKPGLPICDHIAALWPLLTRETATPEPYSSRLPLPHPYVVPGGRFREVYYWDSYFTMLGLDRSRRSSSEHGEELRPPGSHLRPHPERQPHLLPEPFAAAVFLPDGRPARTGAAGEGLCRIPPRTPRRACVLDGRRRGADPGPGSTQGRDDAGRLALNRYWDARDVPRDESYREDVEAAEAAGDIDRRTSVSGHPRSGGKRLGLQLPLVRRR